MILYGDNSRESAGDYYGHVMKLLDYTGWLISTVRDKQATATELLRALREQSSHFGRAKGEFETAIGPDLMRAKSGPGGGLDADPFRAAFVLLAIMLGGKRADIGARVWRTWHMAHEGSELAGFGGDWKTRIVHCEITKKHLFGDALKAILEDEDLARNIDKVRVASDFAEIRNSETKVSRFRESERTDTPPLIRITELDGRVVAGIGSILKG